MAKRKPSAERQPNYPITGIAVTIEATKPGNFCNFKICTLFIIDGEIVHVDKSQEFAMFETIARTEILMDRALWHLSNKYQDGKHLSLGGDDRDKLINQLKKENPKILAKIAPALGIDP